MEAMNPTGQPYGGPPPSRAAQDPREALNVPAILLLVLGGLGVLFDLLSLVSPASDLSFLDRLPGPMDPQAREMATRLGGALAGASRLLALVGVALSGVMAYGAWQMRQLKQYPLALASAIIALLPFGSCCCCLSLPVGVWALVVLSRSEVKDAFQAEAPAR